MPKLRHRVQLRPQIKNLWRALAQITIGKRCWPQLSPSKISSVETESQTGCGILAQVAEHQEAQPILHYLVPRHSRNQFSFFCFLLPRAFLPCQFIRRFWMSQPELYVVYIYIYIGIKLISTLPPPSAEHFLSCCDRDLSNTCQIYVSQNF